MVKEGLRIALGLVVIGLGVYFLYRAAKWTYFALFPPPPSASLSLSAFFEESQAKPPIFSLSGEAQQGGKPVRGKVKISIEKVRGNFRQSFMQELNDGKFAAVGLPAFEWLRKCDRIHVVADVWSPDLTAGTLSEELILNAGNAVRRKSALYPIMWLLVFSILGTFVFVFTGKRTPGKNRIAIILSYCMIILFLAVPLLAPFVFVRAFPDVMEAMKESPVGILITKGEKQDYAQWVLNIGGHANMPSSRCEEPAVVISGKPFGGPLPVGGQTEEKGTSSDELRSMSVSQSQTSVSDASPGHQPNSGVASKPNVESPPENESEVVTLEGGLTVPLYVILLSIIGGAINMTRKVPRIQRDVEESDMKFTLVGIAHKTLAMVKLGTESAMGMETGASTETVETAPDTDQDSSGNENPAAPPQGSSSNSSDWRTNLLDQYMYLLSAPFLAIATYYLLLWLDLNKSPALVLVSFSVGLISERVLSAITGKAGDLLGGADNAGEKPTDPAATAR